MKNGVGVGAAFTVWALIDRGADTG